MAMNKSGVTVLRASLIIVALTIAGYILGPPLYWHFKEALAAVKHSSSSSSPSICAPCHCDCSSQPTFSIPQGLSNISFGDCAKPDPEVNGDTEKNFAELLSEELKLRENDALENQRRADMALLEAKKIASQYQKEADKCNSGMETCEQAREKAELALVAQKKVTALWELRARQKGWKEGVAKSNTQSQGKVQTS
ncbi:putative transmembrane protein [Trifolium repens]|nr:putative transmembrane protein [Trifolium repens]